MNMNLNINMNSNQNPVSPFNDNGTFVELDKLFSVILQSWHLHPTHFGFPQFDKFMAALPNIYYHLVTVQRLQRQAMAMAINKQSIPSLLEITESNIGYTPNPSSVLRASPAHSPVVEVEVDIDSEPEVDSESDSQSDLEMEAKPELKVEVVEEDKDNMENNNPFSLLPAKRNKYRKNRKIAVLDVIEEGKPSPSPPVSPTPYSVSSASPSPSPSTLAMNAMAAEFVPVPPPAVSNKTYSKLETFKPRHAARAKLNIYIPKHMTKQLLPTIREEFPNTNTLYYYLDISTALQINDNQMQVWQTYDGNKLVLINYDLHCVNTEQLLYAVVIANDQHKIEANTEKWLWKIDCFMTQSEIMEKYQIHTEDFPKSSRSMTRGIYDQFQMQYENLEGINDMNMFYEFQWSANEIKQIGSSQKSKKGKKLAEIRVALEIEEWMACCERSWSYLPAIPIIVYENRDINQHWIEWVKMVYIPSQDCYVGVSFRFNEERKSWQIESICLDKGDMHNKHRLISLQCKDGQARFNKFDYEPYFDGFNTRITELQWV